jgi:hypothetical protein
MAFSTQGLSKGPRTTLVDQKPHSTQQR